MLLQALPNCCWGGSLLLVLLFSCTYYAYGVNEKKDADEPTKKSYAPFACWRVPIVAPIFLLINIPVFVLSSMAFALFLIFFPFALLMFRKCWLIEWIRKQALKIGMTLLEIDTRLLIAVGLYRPPIRQISATI